MTFKAALSHIQFLTQRFLLPSLACCTASALESVQPFADSGRVVRLLQVSPPDGRDVIFRWIYGSTITSPSPVTGGEGRSQAQVMISASALVVTAPTDGGTW